MTAAALDDQLCFALYRASTAIVRSYRPRLAALGLTYPQYLVLLCLWQYGDQRTGDIADRLGLPAHGIGPVLRRLQEAGLVRRETEAGDRRAVRVQVTERGAQLQPAAARAQRAVVHDTGLPPAELADLRNLLQALAARLEQARGPLNDRPSRPEHHRPAPPRKERP